METKKRNTWGNAWSKEEKNDQERRMLLELRE